MDPLDGLNPEQRRAAEAVRGPVCILAGWLDADEGFGNPRSYFAWILVLEGLVLGVFAATDVFLFYVVFEAMLVPMYFLIGGFGGENRSKAAVKFLLYNLFGGLIMLAAVIGLVAGFLLGDALGAILALAGAILACLVISDLIAGASRREGSGGGALAFIVALAALVVVAAALLLPVLIVLAILALAWLGISRHRRAQRKHAGLRVLR